MQRVLYNSYGDAALYAIIREAAAGRFELVDARRATTTPSASKAAPSAMP